AQPPPSVRRGTLLSEPRYPAPDASCACDPLCVPVYPSAPTATGTRGARWNSGVVDYVAHFTREVTAFEAAARVAARPDAAPAVRSGPGWVAPALTLPLCRVHRFLVRVIGERWQEEPASLGDDWGWLELPGECASWLPPGHAPHDAAVPSGLADWFGAGAAG